jgi:hypothetical protein
MIAWCIWSETGWGVVGFRRGLVYSLTNAGRLIQPDRRRENHAAGQQILAAGSMAPMGDARPAGQDDLTVVAWSVIEEV